MPAVLQVSVLNVQQVIVAHHQRQQVLVHVQALHLNVVLASNNSALNKKTGLDCRFFYCPEIACLVVWGVSKR